MPKDYARRSQRYFDQEWGKPKRKKFLSWRIILFSIGLIIILMIYSILYIKHHPVDWLKKLNMHHAVRIQTPRLKNKLPSDTPAKPHSAQPIQFDFYQILPNMEVTIPSSENSKTSQVKPSEPTPDVKDDSTASTNIPEKQNTSEIVPLLQDTRQEQFVLQLISLTNASEAKRYQQKLSSKGLQTRLSTAVKNNITFYRIQMGPYKTREEALFAQENLKKQQMTSVMVPVKN